MEAYKENHPANVWNVECTAWGSGGVNTLATFKYLNEHLSHQGFEGYGLSADKWDLCRWAPDGQHAHAMAWWAEGSHSLLCDCDPMIMTPALSWKVWTLSQLHSSASLAHCSLCNQHQGKQIISHSILLHTNCLCIPQTEATLVVFYGSKTFWQVLGIWVLLHKSIYPTKEEFQQTELLTDCSFFLPHNPTETDWAASFIGKHNFLLDSSAFLVSASVNECLADMMGCHKSLSYCNCTDCTLVCDVSAEIFIHSGLVSLFIWFPIMDESQPPPAQPDRKRTSSCS